MHYISNVGVGKPPREQKGLKMEMRKYKSSKSEKQIMEELREGKKVKAIDMLSAMGIDVIICE